MAGLPSIINGTDHSAATSLFSPDYTISYSKYSCVRQFYFWHVTFCYFTFLSGLICLITRALPPRFKKFHAWSGRVYILAMLWSTATSLLIHNTGLPLSTLISFAAVLIGMSIGWFAIIFYRNNIQREAFAEIKAATIDEHGGLQTAISSKIAEILARKTFLQRFISLKSLHGVLFFVSWFNIMGRIFAAPLSNEYSCHTYPVYKPIDTKVFKGLNKPLTLVVENDPFTSRLPWVKVGGDGVWGVIVIGGSGMFMVILLAVASYLGARRSAKKNLDLDMDAVSYEEAAPDSHSD